MDARWYFPLGALFALLAVALGAFGAHGLPVLHGLKGLDPNSIRALEIHGLIENFETGARYHMYHALGLIAVGLGAALARKNSAEENEPSTIAWHVAGSAFLAGILIFSGCLYVIGLGTKYVGGVPLGAIVPVGGVSFLVGWAALAWAGSGLVQR